MEILKTRKIKTAFAFALSSLAMNGCSAEQQCDVKPTATELEGNGMATFIVHGEDDSVATVWVRRNDEGVSVSVSGDVTGPPQQLEDDGFTPPTPIVDGAELSAFGAGGAWIIDVSNDGVEIQGSCEGM